MTLSVFDPFDDELLRAKRSLAEAFLHVVQNEGLSINQHGIGPSILQLAAIFDMGISAPNRDRKHITDTGYNLVPYLKANSGHTILRAADLNQTIFNPETPFTCSSAINERLHNAARQLKIYARGKDVETSKQLNDAADVLNKLNGDVALVEKLHRSVQRVEASYQQGRANSAA